MAVENAGFRLDAGSDRERHRQRQRHDGNGDAGDRILQKAVAIVPFQRIDQVWTKADVKARHAIVCLAAE